MTFRLSALTVLLALVVGFPLVTGCTPPPADTPAAGEDHVHDGESDHAHEGAVDPHDVPITEEQISQLKQETAKYADAVARIQELNSVIESETADGLPESPFDAHQALDKADMILEWLPEIAQNSGVPRDQWGTVNTNAQQLREALDKVHLNIDDKRAPDYQAVADTIDQSLAALEGVKAE